MAKSAKSAPAAAVKVDKKDKKSKKDEKPAPAPAPAKTAKVGFLSVMRRHTFDTDRVYRRM